jgi:cytochrome c oxidase assembly protein subunit 15
MTWLARRDRAPRPVQTGVSVLLAVVVAQAAVGYAQYFSDIPPLLVGIHIAGATAVFAATLVLYLSLFAESRPGEEAPADARDGVLAVA